MARDELEGALADWLNRLGYENRPYEFGSNPKACCALSINGRSGLAVELSDLLMLLFRHEPPVFGPTPLLASFSLYQEETFERLEELIKEKLTRA
jgi:hypothetical protein